MNDLLYLSNIIESIKLIGQYIKNKKINDIKNSTILRDAICKRLEEIGENIRKISLKTKKDYPKVDWVAFVETRNFLTHVYQMINVHKLWEILRKDIPTLKKQIEKIIEDAK